jgi:hypothetical protein
MKYIFFIMLCCIFLPALRAQSPDGHITIKAVFLDSLTKKIVPFASVSLYKNNKLLQRTFTDSVGRIEMHHLARGAYLIRFSMVGYHSLQSKPKAPLNNETVVDFGTIWVMPELVNLKEVIIRGQKPLIEQRVDGIVFNAESLLSIAGSNASDLLRRVPMISVDPAGGLSVKGNSNIRVFIDGKPSELYAPSVADALKAISAENIVKIEVITHPSAKYDAEGTDAVVNIITRKPKTNGSSGNLSVALGNRSENMMSDIHSKYGKWLFNADALYQKYWNRNGSVLERETGSSELLQKNESKQSGDYFFGGPMYCIAPIHSINSAWVTGHGYLLILPAML